MRKVYVIGALALLFAACRPSVSITTPPSAGPTVYFTNYLAIGDDYTGGFTDGTLTVRGQLNSFPMRLFEQFSLIPGAQGGKGPFIQPLINSDNGYPNAKKVLGTFYYSCSSDSVLWPKNFVNYVMDPQDALPYPNPTNNGQINNIGVMGIRMVDYPVQGYGTDANSPATPYSSRFYFDQTITATPQDELKHRVDNLYPTFFTMWLGINDVLGYALDGGQGDGTGSVLPITGTNKYNVRDISPIGAFDTAYDNALNEAIRTGASGALINIPDISLLPFFNTIPSNGLMIDRQSYADSLVNYYYAGQGWKKVFDIGANQFIIKDHNNQTRQSVPGELILMTCPLDSIRCAGWGTTKPIPDTFVLTTDELQFIRLAIERYNYFIKQEADVHHLAYVDMNTFFKNLPTGMPFNGIKYSTTQIWGGAFSLDGIRPTQRGYALMANEIMRVINQFYSSSLTPVDANKYRGIDFP